MSEEEYAEQEQPKKKTQQEEIAKAPPPERVPVRLVDSRGASALVEWSDPDLHRGYVPLQEVAKDSTVPAPVLAEAIPYGVAWEKHLTLEATPEKLAHALRVRGIWTANDLRKKQQVALGAIIATYGVDLGALNRAAHKEE